jgi:hypothetical protein
VGEAFLDGQILKNDMEAVADLEDVQRIFEQDIHSNSVIKETGDNRILDEYGSSLSDRIKQTPINEGKWDGERGNSMWRPENENVVRDLKDFEVAGINYREGVPDFTPVQVFECKMPNQLYERDDDYQFTDCNLALFDYLKDHPDSISNFDDTQLEAIARGNNPSGYTWHHAVNKGRMQLVPTSINSCGHYGGKMYGAEERQTVKKMKVK